MFTPTLTALLTATAASTAVGRLLESTCELSTETHKLSQVNKDASNDKRGERNVKRDV